MYGFKLEKRPDGQVDLALDGRDLAVARDGELARQTLECLLATGKGEWFLNEEEGIDFSAFRGRRMGAETLDRLQTELVGGLAQLDESYTLDSFTHEYEPATRCLRVAFTATNAAGESVSGSSQFGAAGGQ